MRNAQRLQLGGRAAAAVVLTVILGTGSKSGAVVAVSPGAAERAVESEEACPTFSWTAEANAGGYELTVFRIVVAERPERVLTRIAAGSATSWTPGPGECLEAGARYAWTVRTLGVEDRKAGWAVPLRFQIPATPDVAEVAPTQAQIERRQARLRDAKAQNGLACFDGQFAFHRSGNRTCAPSPSTLGASNESGAPLLPLLDSDSDAGDLPSSRIATDLIFQDGVESGNLAAWSAAFPPTCTDGLPNGNETGVDCGGGTCSACPDGQLCNLDSDCLLGSCWLGVCQPSTCPSSCTNDSDCQAPGCVSKVCFMEICI